MKTPVFNFVYSRPYETTIAKAMGKDFSKDDIDRGVELTKALVGTRRKNLELV